MGLAVFSLLAPTTSAPQTSGNVDSPPASHTRSPCEVFTPVGAELGQQHIQDAEVALAGGIMLQGGGGEVRGRRDDAHDRLQEQTLDT